jgi:hypothetical protein
MIGGIRMMNNITNIKERGRWYPVEYCFEKIYKDGLYIGNDFVVSIKYKNNVVGFMTGVCFSMGTFSEYNTELTKVLFEKLVGTTWLMSLDDIVANNICKSYDICYMGEIIKQHWFKFRDKKIVYIDNIWFNNKCGSKHVCRAMFKYLRKMPYVSMIVFNCRDIIKCNFLLNKKSMSINKLRENVFLDSGFKNNINSVAFNSALNLFEDYVFFPSKLIGTKNYVMLINNKTVKYIVDNVV